MDTPVIILFQITALIFSVMVHEIAHGAVALHFGDTTARDAGRLTLNPIKHVDPFGSLLLPLMLFILSGGSFVIGWAKPVPVNPLRLRHSSRALAFVGAAGPLTNLALAAVFAFLLRFGVPLISEPTGGLLAGFFNIIVIINVSLAVFNLVPLPPLDGSNIVLSLLPGRAGAIRMLYARYGFYLLIAFILFGFSFIEPIIWFIYRLLVGV